MKNFTHVSAASLKGAAAAAAEARTLVIAGGTDALGTLKDRVHADAPQTLVDIKTIPGLSSICADKKGLRIGALATLHDIAAHPAIKVRYPALAQAARSVGSPQIRNMGTIGGNICQEPRCWYYRAPEDRFHCLRKGGTHCGALLGENRYHSIFGSARVAAPACAEACPGQVEISAYLGRLRRGEFKQAARIVLERNPLPAMTGRVCPHTCEDKCNRAQFDEAVSIRAVERFLGDYVLAHAAALMPPPRRQTKKRVAVVGSGPAGLAAAYYLRRDGHRVTVFEKLPAAGGMLACGIPAYRLAKDLVRSQIAALEHMGIEFKLNAQVGSRGLTLRALRRDFDAVFLGTGAWRQRSLDLEGAGLLSSGMDFLLDTALGRAAHPGENVLVIGGGNVAVDVAVSARKAGARQVSMACLEARDQMPAFPAEIAEALKEGVDILPAWAPQRVLTDRGRVKGMELVRCTSVFDSQGRFYPSFDPAQKRVIEADRIILAIGQAADLGYLAGALKTARGLIVADADTQAAGRAGVFAGGDAVSGPASVIHAISAGRRAARAIDAYLRGGLPRELLALDTSGHASCPRVETSDEQTLHSEAMHSEARRCVDCSCVAVNASDLAPVLAALGAKIKTTERTLAAEDFFAAVVMKSTVLGPGELVREVFIPPPPAQSRQAYLKFRIRNAIDFPIVGLAGMFSCPGGKFTRARLVLGAVAPVPVRLRAVEAFLKGRKVCEETAAAAAEVAVQDARPLAQNRYKLQIVKALLQKAILAAD
ncbi:MAG: FAD-dependent oxidoreductase [Elusimicrobiota bacterium]